MRATVSSSLPLNNPLRPAALYPWFMALTSIKGIGPATAKALVKLLGKPNLEVHASPPIVRDLMCHLPHGVIDRRQVTPVAQAKKGDYVVVDVMVDEHAAPPRHRPKIPYRVAAHDASADLTITFFNVKGDYVARQLPPGQRRLISGIIDHYDGRATIVHPDIIAPIEKSADILRLTPSYPLTLGISQRVLSKLTAQVAQALRPLPEWLDDAMLRERGWASITQSLQSIHLPKHPDDVLPTSPARARLAYDELLANQLALALLRNDEKRQLSDAIHWDVELHKQFLSALPYGLTQGQEHILRDIAVDMASGLRMTRLLQGDVGSGKTILACAAMLQAAHAGYQAALMAPTDLLARQHVQSLSPIAQALNMRIELLSGKMKAAERTRIAKSLAEGEVALVVGTHALFQEGVQFKNLALIVVDEQHRFGVAERMQLAHKGQAPHLLQMTATPIPRSLTMALYGDMDVSALTERPPGRKPIDTRAIPIARMPEVIEGLARVVRAKEKIYWVCPLIEDSEESNLTAVEERYAELSRIFPGKVGCVHGRMKLKERERTMQDFAFGDLQVLVATTVIEVGVNVPQATVMVIEHAERFGLAQLHQLRGRVGRSDQASSCLLLYHSLNAIAKERLSILRETNDGFLIAEKDLSLRGAGDVLGTRQTGLPDFKLVDFGQHLNLMRVAHQDARLYLEKDPLLSAERGRALRLLLALFEYDAALRQLNSV